MHALRHVNRLLVPGGTLVDLDPVTEEQVAADGGRLGAIVEPECRSVVLPNAEAAFKTKGYRTGCTRGRRRPSSTFLQHFDTGGRPDRGQSGSSGVPIGPRSSHSHSQTAVRHSRALHLAPAAQLVQPDPRVDGVQRRYRTRRASRTPPLRSQGENLRLELVSLLRLPAELPMQRLPVGIGILNAISAGEWFPFLRAGAVRTRRQVVHRKGVELIATVGAAIRARRIRPIRWVLD